MRAVVQRVSKGSCLVNGQVVGKIGHGYLVLLGIGKDDSQQQADKLAKKIINLRILADKKDKMNLALKDVDGQILLISQFTLYANTQKGNRPSFIAAAQPTKAEQLYEYFLAKLEEADIKVETGKFGAMMKIAVELDGPTTIIFDE
jgi:D-tyrosyl-tRNA(Tyr) deacylase